MNSTTRKKRVSKDDWLKAALDTLASKGIDRIKIDVLARQLGIAKTGFYWHFKNRDDLLKEILTYWEREYTKTLIGNPLLEAMAPDERLHAISEAVSDYDLTKYDLAIKNWAQVDSSARKLLENTYQLRFKYIGKAFRELGFKGDELEMRTRLFFCYQTNESDMFGRKITARDRRIRKLRIELLCAQDHQAGTQPHHPAKHKHSGNKKAPS